MEVVNRVYRGKMNSPDFEAIIHQCKTLNLSYKFYFGRPTMLSIKLKPKGTVIFFRTGKFRVMGLLNYSKAKDIIQTLVPHFLSGLELQTETVKFKVPPVHYNFHRRYDEQILFEPEIFPAIHLKQWKDVHVNLFHSGQVIVLGKHALERAHEVKDWLDMV